MAGRILIIDDDAFDTQVLETQLRTHAPAVATKTLHDSEEAVAVFSAYQPDLLLLDIQMPNRNGFEVLQQLSTSAHRTQAKVVMLSSSISDADKDRAERLGADDFRTKPASLKEYRALACELVDQHIN